MRRITVTAKLLNLALAPAAGGRKRPEAVWEKTVAAAVKDAGRPLGADRQFADEQGFALSCLADAVDDMTPLGWQAAVSDIKGRLENRLRISRLVAERPEILDEEIRRPVFVVGLPRTATTLAHKILALSPDHRGPLMWEMWHTDIETDPAVVDRRVRALGKQIGALAKISPLWEVIHPIRVDQPEESMFLLPHGHFHMLVRGPMPQYRRWLDERDTTPDYEYLKLGLQVLQFGRERKRWILKYPLHLNDMDVILKVFPDAKFVWTHRDPTTAMGSLCSLMETAWSMARRRPDLDAIGKLALELMVQAVEKGRSARLAMPPESIVDVPYHLLDADPHTGVPKIYEAIGAEWTERDAANLDDALARPVTDRRHEYGLARYGLDHDGIEAAFGDYTRLVASFNRRRTQGGAGPKTRPARIPVVLAGSFVSGLFASAAAVVFLLAPQGLHQDHAADHDHEQAEQDRRQGRAGVRGLLRVGRVGRGGRRRVRRGLGTGLSARIGRGRVIARGVVGRL